MNINNYEFISTEDIDCIKSRIHSIRMIVASTGCVQNTCDINRQLDEIAKILNGVSSEPTNTICPGDYCGSCEHTDGLCYTSNPPQIRCGITGEFHYYTDVCDVKDNIAKVLSDMNRRCDYGLLQPFLPV